MDLFLTYITDTPTSSGPRLGNTYVAFFNNNRKWAPQLKYCNLRIYTTQMKELFVSTSAICGSGRRKQTTWNRMQHLQKGSTGNMGQGLNHGPRYIVSSVQSTDFGSSHFV